MAARPRAIERDDLAQLGALDRPHPSSSSEIAASMTFGGAYETGVTSRVHPALGSAQSAAAIIFSSCSTLVRWSAPRGSTIRDFGLLSRTDGADGAASAGASASAAAAAAAPASCGVTER